MCCPKLSGIQVIFLLSYMQKYVALHKAVEQRHLNVVKLLVDLGADIRKANGVSHH